jgi:hypothetical protein
LLSLSATPASPRIRNERIWNADRRSLQPAVLLARPRLQQEAHAYRRSTTALPLGLSIAKVQLQAMLPGTRRSADPVVVPIPGAEACAVCAGVTRPRPVPVQRAPRGLVCSARRLMPEAARERFATPPAGTALAPVPRYAFAAGPFRERESRTACNCNSDKMSRTQYCTRSTISRSRNLSPKRRIR